MLRDMASLTRGETTGGLADPFGYGFSDSGIYTLIDGREIDMGVDWNEPLDVRARAVRRALRRRLGAAVFERYECFPSTLTLPAKTFQGGSVLPQSLQVRVYP